MEPEFLVAICVIPFCCICVLLAWHWHKASKSRHEHRKRSWQPFVSWDNDYEAGVWNDSSPTLSVCSNDWRKELDVRIEDDLDEKSSLASRSSKATSQASSTTLVNSEKDVEEPKTPWAYVEACSA